MNWTPAEASVQPDPAMWDLISYLQVTFAQLSELPTSVREAVHFASCIHISKSLEQILYGPNIKKITPAAIMNLKRNLDALLEFIDGLKIHHLRESFSALSQIIDLLISGNLEIFLDPQSRYNFFFHLRLIYMICFRTEEPRRIFLSYHRIMLLQSVKR